MAARRGCSVVVVRGLLIAVASLVGKRALWHLGFGSVAPGLQGTGSRVVVHRLSCSVAYGLLLDQGSNLSLLLAGGFFASELPGKL